MTEVFLDDSYCISFVAMQTRAITQVLTADEYFRQAGFRALMREEPLLP
jgi:predicted nucleic acid-binding protein